MCFNSGKFYYGKNIDVGENKSEKFNFFFSLLLKFRVGGYVKLIKKMLALLNFPFNYF